MAKTGDYKVPFDSSGNLLHYAGYGAITWRDNAPFTTTLGIREMRRGRSAKYIIWEDEEGHEYPMFVADLLDLCKRGAIQEGLTAPHEWVVRKRGQNYGIRLANG